MVSQIEKRFTNSIVSSVGLLFILFLIIGILYSEYKEDVNHNKNMINFPTTIKNYSIILTTCKDFICYKGQIVIYVNETVCYFEKVIDPIYENVENWLNQYYPLNSKISIEFNIENKKCDNYRNIKSLYIAIILLTVVSCSDFIIIILILSTFYNGYYKNRQFQQLEV